MAFVRDSWTSGRQRYTRQDNGNTGTESHSHIRETTDYRSVVAHTFNPGPREAGAGWSIEEFQDNKDCYTVWGDGRKTTI